MCPPAFFLSSVSMTVGAIRLQSLQPPVGTQHWWPSPSPVTLPFTVSRDLSTGLVFGITWIEAFNGAGSEEEGNRC